MAKKVNKAYRRLDRRIKQWEATRGLGACPKHTHRKPGSMKK